MTYQPVIPVSGLPGWRFLQRTEAAQRSTFEASAQVKRETEYFRDKIGSVRNVEDLLADRTLLKVALGAFGLDEDLNKRGFVRKVLEEGTETPQAFAMRLTNTAYRKLSAAFGFADARGVQTNAPGFADTVAKEYQSRAFVVAVGETDNSMRLALNFRRTMTDTISQRAQADARVTFASSAQVTADTDAFERDIGAVVTIDDLMNDATLLKVALGAFGLADDPAARADVRRALEEGTESATAFAVQPANAQYRAFATAFGFGNAAGVQTAAAGFGAALADDYKIRGYAVAVGETEFALDFRGSRTTTLSASSNNANWFSIMGDTPLRTVVEKALGVPAGVGKLDIDRQLEIFKDRAASVLGTSRATDLADPKVMDEVIRRFLLREQIDGGGAQATAYSGALRLLQGGGAGASSGLFNLLLSRG